MNDQKFSVIGVILPVRDIPCFCTTVFRDTDGMGTYLQSQSRDGIIQEFVPIYLKSNWGAFVPLYRNECVSVGDRFMHAFKDITSRIIVGNVESISSATRETIGLYESYPFLRLQMSIFAGDAIEFEKSISHPLILERLGNGSFVIDFGTAGAKSDNDIKAMNILILLLIFVLYEKQFGTKDIARISNVKEEVVSDVIFETSKTEKMHFSGLFRRADINVFDINNKFTSLIEGYNNIFSQKSYLSLNKNYNSIKNLREFSRKKPK